VVGLVALRKIEHLSLAALAALVCFVVFIASVFVDVFADALDAWAPNVGVGALSIAATLLVVERIVQHEARRRLWPRVELLMRSLRMEFFLFLQAMTVDYGGTHLNNFRPIKRDCLDFLDQWLTEKDTQDACQVSYEDDRPIVIQHGALLGKALRAYRDQDLDVMEPALVRAIDDFMWHGWQHGETMYELRAHAAVGTGVSGAEKRVVSAALAFGEVLALHDPQGRLQFDDLAISVTEEHSRNLRRGHWQWYADQR
jgi:hypothetical protein